ncbi:hypothetical protein KR200_010017 [Drosophila serrata]|nr:hypothetical protein KR200_010017 [Drosophila serrata]
MNTHNSITVKKQILDMTIQYGDQLHGLWMHIFEPNTVNEFLHRLRDHVETFYMDLLTDSQEKQQTILGEIAVLRAEASSLTSLLHKSTDIYERSNNSPLVVQQMELNKSIEYLREELASRRAEICELLLQQDQLCEELDEVPLTLAEDPLPLPEEVDAFRSHLAQLRDQRVQRLKEIGQLRESIWADMKTLEVLPITASEVHLLCQDNQSPKLEVLTQLRDMQKEYSRQVQELHDQIDTMRQKIELLWKRLPDTDAFNKQQVREAKDYTQSTYDVLLEELHRCQAIRSKNMRTYIEQLRSEIKIWWELTLKSPEERTLFTAYFADSESEDILELHEMELDGLKDFYNSNQKIFELYAHRAELWSRMEALVAKANDPNRFNNRGGQLLKEEKDRKAISAKLPKIEQQITELVNVYVSQANTPFLVYGEDIHKSMAMEWEQLRQAKQQPPVGKTQLSRSVSKIFPPSEPLSLKLQKKETSSSIRKSPSTQRNGNSLTTLDRQNSCTVQSVNSQLKPPLHRDK